MADQSIEDLLPKSGDSVYRLVRMASMRALELSEGKKKLINNATTDKVTTTALEEIAQGAVVYKESSDQLRTLEAIEAETQKEEVI